MKPLEYSEAEKIDQIIKDSSPQPNFNLFQVAVLDLKPNLFIRRPHKVYPAPSEQLKAKLVPLPVEAWLTILSSLEDSSLIMLIQSCKTLRNLADEDEISARLYTFDKSRQASAPFKAMISFFKSPTPTLSISSFRDTRMETVYTQPKS